MLAWRAGEVHLLVKEQESAVKEVRLERLVGSVGQTQQLNKRSRKEKDNESKLSGSKTSTKGQSFDESDEEDEVELTAAEKRKIMFLTETPRPWLTPYFSK